VPEPEPAPEPDPEPVPEVPPIDDYPPIAEPQSGYEDPAPQEDEWDEDDEYSQFDPEVPFRPRRNRLRIWTIAALIFAALAAGTVVAVNYWGLPSWVPIDRPTFGLGDRDLVLDFPSERQERRKLPNGTELFSVSGSVTNVSGQAREVPTILVVLRDERDTKVYEIEVPPTKTTLAPGESMAVNHAELDVPRRARYAEFGWKPG
jgi:hypothetical protein